MKVTLIKVSADGEQLSIEEHVSGDQVKLHQQGKQHLYKSLAPMFDLADARLLEMNQRIMAQNYMYKKASPEVQAIVTNILDILVGRQSGPPKEEILEQARAEYEAQRKIEQERTQAATAASPLQGAKSFLPPDLPVDAADL